MTKKTTASERGWAAWPDFSALPKPNGEREDDQRELQLFRYTIAAFEEIERNQIGALIAIKPISRSTGPHELVHKEDYEEILIERIAHHLFGPAKQKRNGLGPKRAQAVEDIRAIFSGDDAELKNKLQARLSRPRATKKRAAYDRLVLQMLTGVSKAIRCIWEYEGVKRWKNMPTPNDAAVEYCLKVRGQSDDDEARQRIRTELEKFSRRPR